MGDVPVTMSEFMNQEMQQTLEVARGNLLEDGDLVPLAIYFRSGREPQVQELDFSSADGSSRSRELVRKAIASELPDMVIVVSSVYVDLVDASGQAGEAEGIAVMGGCVGAQRLLLQPYRWCGQDIVMEEPVLTDEEVDDFFGGAWDIREAEGAVYH